MNNKLKFSFYVSLVSLACLLLSCSGQLKTLKYYYAGESTELSKNQTKRLSNYLNGEFYSYEIGRNVSAYPVAFLISDSGKKSVILACEGITNECNISVQIYQILKKYEKKNKEKFYILALEKTLIHNYKFREQLSKKKINLKKNKNIFFDYIFLPTDSCSSDDC